MTWLVSVLLFHVLTLKVQAYLNRSAINHNNDSMNEEFVPPRFKIARELTQEDDKQLRAPWSTASSVVGAGARSLKFSFLAICELWRSRLSLQTSPFLIVMLAAMFGVNAPASDSSEIVAIAPPALAFARYIASLDQRSQFTESGPVRVDIDASLPGLGKQASMSAIRDTAVSECSQYQILQLEGDPTARREVIA